MKSQVRLLCVIWAVSAAFAVIGCSSNKTAEAPPKSSKSTTAAKAERGNSAEKTASSKTESKDSKNTDASNPAGATAQLPGGLNSLLSSQNSATGANPLLSGASSSPAKSGAANSASQPQAKQLLIAMQRVYGTAKSVRTEWYANASVTVDGKVVRNQKNVKNMMLFKRPNKFVIKGPLSSTFIDGKKIVDYSPKAKRYAEMKFNNNILQSMAYSEPGVKVVGLLLGADYTREISEYLPLKDAKIAGKDAYLVSLKLKTAPGVNAVQSLWVDKKTLFIYKNDISIEQRPKPVKNAKIKIPKVIITKISSVASSFDPNAKAPDSAFAFHAPAGVKPIERPKQVNLMKKPAPDFSFKWTDGSEKKLSDFRGKTVLLNCWALPMCEKELPIMQKFYKEHKDDVQIISINFNNNPQKVREYLDKNGFNFPVVQANTQMAEFVARNYGLMGLPTTYIIDKEGIVRGGMLGIPSEKEIATKIDKVVGGN